MKPRLSDRALLERLVAFESVSGRSNLPIADFVCDYLDRPGISIDRIASEDGGRVNVLAVAGAGEAGPDGAGLMLCGHLDVVPAEESGWSSEPFALAESGANYVGRGACDMKGFDALAVNVMAETDPRSLSHPLALLLTYDEELGSLGAHRFVECWREDRTLPSQVAIGEPTSLRIVRMHKGHLKMRITLCGRSAHSGSPQLGVNAIVPAGEVVRRLAEFDRQLGRRPSEQGRFFGAVPQAVLTVATIRGGSAVNVVPDRCTIEIGIRLLPGDQSGPVIEQVRQLVAEAAGEARASTEVIHDNPPLLCAESAPVARLLTELLGQTESFGVSFASDGGALSTLGLNCVLFGPGTIEAAHRPDEYVPISELRDARSVLERMVGALCRSAAPERPGHA